MQLTQKSQLIIQYSDLISKNTQVIESLLNFIGRGEIKHALNFINPKLNRTKPEKSFKTDKSEEIKQAVIFNDYTILHKYKPDKELYWINKNKIQQQIIGKLNKRVRVY